MKHFFVTLAALAVPAAMAAESCQVRSSAVMPTVVELYTSEGCSSCPPADRWLSGLKGKPDVIALAFHVDYWDRLGWADRYASAAATERQYQLARARGSAQVYTPQVVVDGQDWPRWPDLPGRGAASPVEMTLARDGNNVVATIAAASAARALSGYWAVTENNHVSRVSAGENSGETLRHDHVVRLYQPVGDWSATQAQRWSLPVLPGVAEHPRRVTFVVTDPKTQRPLQALALDC